MEEKKERLTSVSDVSRILRVSERQVRRYCKTGKLHCEKRGKGLIIDLASVLAFLKSNAFKTDTDTSSDEINRADTDTSDVPDETDVRKKTARVYDATSDFAETRTDVPVNEADVRKMSAKSDEDDLDTGTTDVPKVSVVQNDADIDDAHPDPDIPRMDKRELEVTVAELLEWLRSAIAENYRKERLFLASMEEAVAMLEEAVEREWSTSRNVHKRLSDLIRQINNASPRKSARIRRRIKKWSSRKVLIFLILATLLLGALTWFYPDWLIIEEVIVE